MQRPKEYDRIWLYNFELALEQRGYTACDYALWYSHYRLKRGQKFPTPQEFAADRLLISFVRYMKLRLRTYKKLKAVYDKKGRFVDIEDF